MDSLDSALARQRRTFTTIHVVGLLFALTLTVAVGALVLGVLVHLRKSGTGGGETALGDTAQTGETGSKVTWTALTGNKPIGTVVGYVYFSKRGDFVHLRIPKLTVPSAEEVGVKLPVACAPQTDVNVDVMVTTAAGRQRAALNLTFDSAETTLQVVGFPSLTGLDEFSFSFSPRLVGA